MGTKDGLGGSRDGNGAETKLDQGWGWGDKDWGRIRDGDRRGQGMRMRGTWAGASGARNGVRGLRQELGMEQGWGWRDQGWGSGGEDRAGDRGRVQGDRDTHGSGDGAGDPPVP